MGSVASGLVLSRGHLVLGAAPVCALSLLAAVGSVVIWSVVVPFGVWAVMSVGLAGLVVLFVVVPLYGVDVI